MVKVSDAYSWEDLAAFTEEDMGNLLAYYASGSVPELDVLLTQRKEPDLTRSGVFDGSFGFSVGG
jgi:hypothetical protein